MCGCISYGLGKKTSCRLLSRYGNMFRVVLIDNLRPSSMRRVVHNSALHNCRDVARSLELIVYIKYYFINY